GGLEGHFAQADAAPLAADVDELQDAMPTGTRSDASHDAVLSKHASCRHTSATFSPVGGGQYSARSLRALWTRSSGLVALGRPLFLLDPRLQIEGVIAHHFAAVSPNLHVWDFLVLGELPKRSLGDPQGRGGFFRLKKQSVGK